MSKKIPDIVFGMDDIPAALTNDELNEEGNDTDSVVVGENENTQSVSKKDEVLQLTPEERAAYNTLLLTKPKLKYGTPSDLYKSLKSRDVDDSEGAEMMALHKQVKEFVSENAEIADQDFQKIRKKHPSLRRRLSSAKRQSRRSTRRTTSAGSARTCH